jgi:signal transduction histidine kinase
VKKAERDLHQLAHELQAAREEERTRVARELHDGPVQSLTALRMELAWIGSRCKKAAAETRERLRAAAELTEQAIRALRQMSSDLRPGILDLGLGAAIEWQAEELQARWGIPCAVQITVEDGVWGPRTAAEIFRICEESTNLLARDAGAKRITVTLKAERGAYVLEVNAAGAAPLLGRQIAMRLLALRERAAGIGGVCRVVARKKTAGLRLRIRMPLTKVK